MSAFNQARYNLSQFNIVSAGEISVSGAAVVSFSFSFLGTTNYCRGNSQLEFASDGITIDKGKTFRGNSAEVFETENAVLGYMDIIGTGAEVFQTETGKISQIANTNGSAAETIDIDKMNISQSAAVDGSAAESFDLTKMNMSQKVYAGFDSGEVFQATIDVISLVEYVCEFPNLTLKPGQELVIDANAFNVLLDKQNAIHLQKGDWLDNLNRNTQSIEISGTGATRLTAEILYTERYL